MEDGKQTDAKSALSPGFDDRLKRAKDEAGLSQDEAAEALEHARLNANSAMGMGFRIGIELVVGVGVGSYLGWLADKWLETSPWVMIFGFLLGFAAGLRNVIRTSQRMAAKQVEKKEE